MPEPKVKLLLILTHPYSAMLDTCSVTTAFMKRGKTIFNLPWAVGNLIKFA